MGTALLPIITSFLQSTTTISAVSTTSVVTSAGSALPSLLYPSRTTASVLDISEEIKQLEEEKDRFLHTVDFISQQQAELEAWKRLWVVVIGQK
uniref:Uncharacterized protein n=1 Tax=Wuchereria bancrofti TaxID=6293 RepID=A0A1I8EYV4_WUCBA